MPVDIDSDPLDRTRFPVDEWALTEHRFSADDLGVTETLFSVGNGYLGLRGNYEESRDAHTNGTFINGFHETWPITHAEEAYGFAQVGQTIVNVPDAKIIRLYVDDEPLELSKADLLDYNRTLDFRTGVLTRTLLWRTPSGKRVEVRSTRMVSLSQRHLAVMTFEVTMLDATTPVQISSQILNRQDMPVAEQERSGSGMNDPRKAAEFSSRVLLPEVSSGDSESGRLIVGYRCADSGMTLGMVADHLIDTDNPTRATAHVEDDRVKMIYRVHAQKGVPVRLTKYVSAHTATSVPPQELIDRCERTLERVVDEGLDAQHAAQCAWLDHYWKRADVEVAGHSAVQQAIRWNIFSLAQASARAETYGIPAKGVTGSGYGGHYFWDTEIYVMPFLTYTLPYAARNALRFRLSLLDAARKRARELSQRGALFAWRTINGEEASAYYAAGTAQYHIDADIAYALSQYVGATGDIEFLESGALDIFVETARLWADLGFWRTHPDGSATFHIHGVTGPDEYTTVVNDNLYTNVLARFNLRRAAEAVKAVREASPAAYAETVRRTGVTDAEIAEWTRCADHMHIPFDENIGIHPQDAQFLEREMWDLEHTPPEMRPLLLHHHPLVIYRFQVLKQADVVLALFLQGEDFTAQEKLADFEYYDPITTGDSTLSAVVQSIIAAEVGYQDLAYRYFLAALFVDLADRHANTSDGVHVASTGGVWSVLTSGFGGFRDLGMDHGEGQFTFDPRLPSAWESLTFRLCLHQTRVRCTVRAASIDFEVEEGLATLTFVVRGEPVLVGPGAPVSVALADQGPLRAGSPKAPSEIVREDGTVIASVVPTGDTQEIPVVKVG